MSDERVPRAELARRAGVARSAVTNWEGRHPDFPTPERVNGVDYFSLLAVLDWLGDRPVPAGSRRVGEPLDVTYADRVRATTDAVKRGAGGTATRLGGTAPVATASDAETGETRGDAVQPVARLLREHELGTWGASSSPAFAHLLVSLAYLRQVEPERFAELRRSVALGEGGLPVHRIVPTVAEHVEASLAGHGVATSMGSRLEGVVPPGRRQAVDLLAEVDALGREDFGDLLTHLAQRMGLDSAHTVTPRGVTVLIARLLDSDRAASLSDPNGRAGELLCSVLEERTRRGAGTLPTVELGTTDRETLVLAVMNLLVHGVRPRWRERRGTAGPWATAVSPPRADLVLTNPPFNAPAAPLGNTPWPYGPPPAANANLAWVQECVSCLNEGGRAAVLMPNNAAFSHNARERHIRGALVRHGVVECVIALPPRLFPTTAISVNLWILRPGRPDPAFRDVLFVNASELGTKVSRRLTELGAADIDRIVDVYRAWTAGSRTPSDASDPPCAVVPGREVRAPAFSLNPADHVVPPAPVEEPSTGLVESSAVLRRLDAEAADADDRADSRWASVLLPGAGTGGASPARWERRPLGELCTAQAGPSPAQLTSKLHVKGGPVPVVQPKHLRDHQIAHTGDTAVSGATRERFSRFALRAGDILCARTGTVGPAAQVRPEQSGWLFGSNLIRLHTFSPDVDPAYLLAYLSLPSTVDWIRGRAEKTTVPSISVPDLCTLEVALPPPDEQTRIGSVLSALDEKVVAHRALADGTARAREALARHLMAPGAARSADRAPVRYRFTSGGSGR